MTLLTLEIWFREFRLSLQMRGRASILDSLDARHSLAKGPMGTVEMLDFSTRALSGALG